MTVPPLFDPLDTGDEDQLRRDTTSWDAGFETGAEHQAKRAHPGDVRERAQAWLHVEPFYWTMRVVYVCLAAGAVFAVYINGVADGWWRAWGEKPSVAATAPAAQPTPAPSLSSEAAMSGGYQVGPDGVLVRPAQYAADTYTKPELPEEAKENTERGAELAAEYVLETLTYAWNTGDTQPFADVTEPGEEFRESHIKNINALYSYGWMYGNNATVTHIVSVLPVSTEEWGVEPNTIAVVLDGTTNNGISCVEQRIIDNNSDMSVTFAFFMTWKHGAWISTGGAVNNADSK